VDDILILTPPGHAEAVAKELMAGLQSLGLHPHPFGPDSKSKFAPLTDPFSFLGYQVEGGHVIIRRDSILRFESSIANIFTRIGTRWRRPIFPRTWNAPGRTANGRSTCG
jgi:hypothetical protein